MKKMRMLLLAVTGIVSLSLVACAPSESKGIDENLSISATPAESPEAEDVTIETGEAASETKTGEASVSEQVLLDKDGIVITAKSLDYDAFLGPELKLTLENNSDQGVTVQVRDVSVNGLMIDPLFSCEIEPGKKANDGITFMSSTLEENGIDTIGSIELKFHVFLSGDWETLFDTDDILIETSAAADVGSGEVGGTKVIFEQDGITISYKEFDMDAFLGVDMKIFVDNQSDKAIIVQARDVSVNGFMVDPLFSCDVMPGKKANDGLTIMESQLEENGITEIEEIEFKFHIFEKESYDKIVDTDPIIIKK